jgi:hypothetical protein
LCLENVHFQLVKKNFFPDFFSFWLGAKVRSLLSTLLLFLLFLILAEGCKGTKGGQAGDKKARTGWFARIFGKKKKGLSLPAKEIEKVIQTARSYRGTPHKTGGMNRYGIDCSALMQVSFESAQISIPRTAAQQSQIGKAITRQELRPGDLVFFSDPKVGKGITHVGLVTEVSESGEVKFIHTSSRLGVTENLLSTDYFNRTYAKSVRVY